MADFTYDDVQRCGKFREHAYPVIPLECWDDSNHRSIFFDIETGIPYIAATRIVGSMGAWAASNAEVFVEEPRELSCNQVIDIVEACHPGCGAKYAGINADNWREYWENPHCCYKEI